jgi:hypothetical protein
MDRIRAGLTGLAAVFLVTAAASLLFAPDEAEKIAAEAQEPGEPLAQLGVAPGSDKGEVGGATDAPEAAAPEAPEPGLEAQPSGGPPAPGMEPALPSPAGSGGRPDPDRPVAI